MGFEAGVFAEKVSNLAPLTADSYPPTFTALLLWIVPLEKLPDQHAQAVAACLVLLLAQGFDLLPRAGDQAAPNNRPEYTALELVSTRKSRWCADSVDGVRFCLS